MLVEIGRHELGALPARTALLYSSTVAMTASTGSPAFLTASSIVLPEATLRPSFSKRASVLERMLLFASASWPMSR